MRNVTFWYPDLPRLHRALFAAWQQQELALPADEMACDGEWILANFEVSEGNLTTTAAGRASLASGAPAVSFEARDWDRLFKFCGARTAQGAPAPVAGAEGSGDAEEEPPKTVPTPLSAAFAAGPSLKARVLLVEDDTDTRDMVSIMLESVGLDVVMTNSAEGGLELLSRNDFEILVLDWNLPGMSGVEMCRSVRTEGRNTTLAVLFLTGNTSQQDMLEAFASGADDYVTKPFRAAELGARIFALLRRARMAPRPPG
ncbi:MAG: response regulator transcription factor [Deltaproteobacteria bacterium]|nr:response regulator transcription factor [Deltaproteobacteria bacterium]